VLTFNGRAFPGTAPLVAKYGDRVRIRFGNLSPMEHHPIHLHGERLTNCTVDGVAGFQRLVAGGPSAGREFSDSIDRKIGQAREHRAEVVADR